MQRPGAMQGRSVASEAAVAASGSVAGAFCGLRSSSCSVRERCLNFLWAQKQQLQRPAALQEHSVGSEAAVAASRTLQKRSVGSEAAVTASWSVLWPQRQQLQCPGALQERSEASEVAVAEPCSVQERSVALEVAVAASERSRSVLWP